MPTAVSNSERAGIAPPRTARSMAPVQTLQKCAGRERLPHGAPRCYDRIVVLEDDRATAEHLTVALVDLSVTHTVDQLLSVHGLERSLVGYKGREYVDAAAFDVLLARYVEYDSLLDLRVVYGVNCYGASLASTLACDHVQDRDVNAALNILARGNFAPVAQPHQYAVLPETYTVQLSI